MKHRLLYTLLAVVAAIVTAGCSSDSDYVGSHVGWIHPTVTVNPAIKAPHASLITELGYECPDVDQIMLNVTGGENDTATAHFASVADYPTDEPLLTGQYTLTAYSSDNIEGFDQPIFLGRREINVEPNTTTDVEIECSIINSLFRVVYTPEALAYAPDMALTLHSTIGGSYISYPADESRYLFLLPGEIRAIVSFTTGASHSIAIEPDLALRAEAARLYTLTVDVDTSTGPDPILSIAIDDAPDDVATVALTHQLLTAASPVVSPVGFTFGTPLDIIEGDDPKGRVAMELSGGTPSSLTLTINSLSLLAKGMPLEVDLLNADDSTLDTLRSMGLRWDDRCIDFTELIPNIDYYASMPTSTFTVVARTTSGLINMPATLAIGTATADIEVQQYGHAFVGVDSATIVISSRITDLRQNLQIMRLDHEEWVECPVRTVKRADSDRWNVSFSIPANDQDIRIRVVYCDRTKAEGTIQRTSPEFSVTADPFARVVRLLITPAEPQLLPLIVNNLSVYNDATGDKLTVYSRNTSTGIVEVAGLEPVTRYRLRCSVMLPPLEPSDYCTVAILTEQTLEVPNGDFEDCKKEINYKHLPSGGRYSQTIVSIFNMQNFTDFQVSVPRQWATTNAKTFCTAAANHNTWYMHPSVSAIIDPSTGSQGVEIVNCAWDTHGPDIPDYTQQSQPYLNYNPHIPQIAHRSAGRMWLGSYGFNASTGEETITEGVAFESRPLYLNGLYTYTPGDGTAMDKAVVKVKVWGRDGSDELLIGSGELLLSYSPQTTSFAVPITYKKFGVKASKICIIFAASSHLGSIEYETKTIVTTPDPVTATSTGNRLWVDNLSFGY